MNDEPLPVLPGFREIAQRRRELVAELAERRRAAGLSQIEVAQRMGTSQPAVARLEAGEVDVRMSTVERYAAAVGCRLEMRLDPVPERTRRGERNR
jgi:transcriptional regulator with XRE-family HTH domain